MKNKLTTLVLKRCIEGGKAYNGFRYPKAGEVVEAEDWEDSKECGNGLHGLHGWTEDNWMYYDSDLKGNWVVLEVNKEDGFVELGDKVKFKRGKVLYNGESLDMAKELMLKQHPKMVFHFDNQKGGNYSTQTAGAYSTQKAGSNSAQTAGSNSTQKAGSHSTQTAGDYSTQTAGAYSTQKAWYSSTQTAGAYSTQKAWYSSTQTAGYSSTQTAGDNSFICHYVENGYINTVTAGKNTSITSINPITGESRTFINKVAGTTYEIGGDCIAKEVNRG